MTKTEIGMDAGDTRKENHTAVFFSDYLKESALSVRTIEICDSDQY